MFSVECLICVGLLTTRKFLKETEDNGIDEVDYAKQVEPPSERKQRYFSLAVITFTAFTFNLSFSIILTSAKPYLDQVNIV